MGLYVGGRKGVSSTAEIAKLLNAPVLLVIDSKSMGASAAATALGFRAYDPEVQLAGVILNRLGSATHEAMIRAPLALKVSMTPMTSESSLQWYSKALTIVLSGLPTAGWTTMSFGLLMTMRSSSS